MISEFNNKNNKHNKKMPKQVNKVVENVKGSWTTIIKKAEHIGKKDIPYVVRMPRWFKITVLPIMIMWLVSLATDNGLQKEIVHNILAIPTLGLFGLTFAEGTKTLSSGEEITWIYKTWQVSFNPLADVSANIEGVKYVAIYMFWGIIFWGSSLAFFGSFGDSKRTTDLIVKYSKQLERELLMTNKPIIKNEFKTTIIEKIIMTEFWKRASLEDKKITIRDFFLPIPLLCVIYIWIKKAMFTSGFVENEFQIYWNTNMIIYEEAEDKKNKGEQDNEER